MNDTSDKYANFSHDELVAEINRLKKHKKYGLVWEHKTEKVIEDFETQQPYLEEVTDKRIEDAPGEPTNLIIEGDNFEALSILNYTHAGKVDVIYIDPPYNTGNKDFIYNDNYVDSEDEFRHSKWLSFMEPRLKLAKNLLKDDGVIFISIDDNEASSLIQLSLEVFNERNFIQTFLWNKAAAGSQLSKYTRSDYEYVVCLAKNKDSIDYEFFGKRSEGMSDSKLYNAGNKYSSLSFPAGTINFPSIENGVIEPFKLGDFELKQRLSIKNGTNENNVVIYSEWKWKQSKLDEELKNGTEIISKTDGLRLRYRRANDGAIIKPTKSISNKDGVGYTVSGTSELQSIFGKGNNMFSFPKPPTLIKYLCNMITYRNKEAVILDFFAGSGTTGQAVLELNKEDGGHRQFILCTNNGDKGPDSTKIAEEITYPRIKTVITGVRQDGSKYSDGIPANLRYYKINHREKKPSIDANRQDIVTYMENIIQVKENAYKQLEVNEDFAIYESSEKYVGLVFEPFSLEEVITNLKEQNREKRPVKLYVFSYSRDAFEDDYGADFEIEFVAMPEGLLKTYAHIVEEQKKEDL